jgi:hypothetical protein
MNCCSSSQSLWDLQLWACFNCCSSSQSLWDLQLWTCFNCCSSSHSHCEIFNYEHALIVVPHLTVIVRASWSCFDCCSSSQS